MRLLLSILLFSFALISCEKEIEIQNDEPPKFIYQYKQVEGKVTQTRITYTNTRISPWGGVDSVVKQVPLIYDCGAEKIMRGDLYWLPYTKLNGRYRYIIAGRALEYSPYWICKSGYFMGLKCDTLWVNPSARMNLSGGWVYGKPIYQGVDPIEYSCQEQLIVASDSVIAFRFWSKLNNANTGGADSARFHVVTLHPSSKNNPITSTLGGGGYAVRTMRLGQDALSVTYRSQLGTIVTETLIR